MSSVLPLVVLAILAASLWVPPLYRRTFSRIFRHNFRQQARIHMAFASIDQYEFANRLICSIIVGALCAAAVYSILARR